jgi:hypothetical protein
LIFRPSFINDPLPGNRSIKARVRADAIDYSSAQDQTSGFFTAQPLPMRFPNHFVSIGKATQNLWILIGLRRRASRRTKAATHLKPLPHGSLFAMRGDQIVCCGAIKHAHRV